MQEAQPSGKGTNGNECCASGPTEWCGLGGEVERARPGSPQPLEAGATPPCASNVWSGHNAGQGPVVTVKRHTGPEGCEFQQVEDLLEPVSAKAVDDEMVVFWPQPSQWFYGGLEWPVILPVR